MDTTQLNDLITWLAEGARSAVRTDLFMSETCERMVACGIPLFRVGVFVRTLHPSMMGRGFIWRAGAGVTLGSMAHGEEDGEEAVWWLYNYAQANSLNESALAAKMKAYDKNTLYQVFRGSYGVNNKDGRHASWANVVKAIKAFKAVAIEEAKKRNIGILDTEVKRTVWQCCDAALNDGMVSFIYGPTRCGKTCSLKAYQRAHNHGQTVYIELGSG